MDSLTFGQTKVQQHEAHATKAHKFRTLVIDVDAHRFSTGQYLRRHGHDVKLCQSLDEAALVIAEQSFELVLVGYSLDTSSARIAVEYLRTRLGSRTTILSVTLAPDCQASALELVSSGADSFIPLPIDSPAAYERLSKIEKNILAQKEQQRFELTAGENAERFRAITDHSPVFFRITGPDGLAAYFNRAWLAFTGRQVEREMGYGWAELIRPDQREDVLATILTSLKNQAPFRVEYLLRRHDGEYRWLLDLGTPRFAEDGTFCGHVGSCTDITDLKQSEEALRRAEEKYRSIFENAIEGIFQTTPDGRYLNANRALSRIYGYNSPEELMTRLTDIAHQLYVRKGRREEFVRLLREHDIVENFESQIYRRDGSIIWIAENSRAIRDSSGRVLYYEGTVEDITDRKQTAERLRLMESAVIHAQDALTVLEAAEKAGGGELEIVYVNQAFTRLTGYESADVIGCAPTILNGARTEQPALDRMQLAFLNSQPFDVELAQYRKNGSEYWADIHISPIFDEGGRITHFVSVQRDITQRRKTEQALRESEERYALAATGANDGLWDWNIQTGKVYYSPRWKAMLGLEAVAVSASPEEWFSRVHEGDIADVRENLNAHLEGNSETFRCEFRMRHEDETYRWMISRGVVVRSKDGIALRMAGSQTDISGRKLAELQLKHDAYHDTLTGLPNRALLMDRLRQAISRGKRRPDYKFVLLFLDLDRFKVINDSMGHIAGDQLLIAIARRLELCLRPSDTVARLGGDEFIILLDDLRDVGAQTVASRIQDQLAESFRVEGREVYISASIGITTGNADIDRAEDLLREADTAMYRAKCAGKNRHETFQTSMHLHAVSTLNMEADLRHAIERHEFFLEYQPIVSLSDRSIQGFEALVRWRHPDRGIVPPNQFIPLAEETGLISPISEWVLNEACRQFREWTDTTKLARQLSICVNMSGRCCADVKMAELIGDVLLKTGVPSSCLKLELTESNIVERARQTDAFFAQLKKMNVRVLIDDFGTGYSSLSYIHRIPADAIKVDRSFVRDMMTAEKNLEIIRAVIALARTVKMEVIAEGVETKEQLEKLCDLRCDGAQGFLFSRPIDSATAVKLIESGVC